MTSQNTNTAGPYGIVGSGRLSTHLQKYFKLEGIKFKVWSRKNKTKPENSLAGCRVILLPIPDGEIEGFILKNPFLKNKILIHFSGCLHTPLAYGCHPLYSFTRAKISFEDYQKIIFVCDINARKFRKVFPRLKNKVYRIKAKDKPYYHALCVMSANFTVMLWQKAFETFKNKYGIANEDIAGFMSSVFNNLKADYKTALSGPFTRGDKATINKNISALKGDSFQKIYKAFYAASAVIARTEGTKQSHK